eukprot:6357464-Pyramimonas_sp.AAC.1
MAASTPAGGGEGGSRGRPGVGRARRVSTARRTKPPALHGATNGSNAAKYSGSARTMRTYSASESSSSPPAAPTCATRTPDICPSTASYTAKYRWVGRVSGRLSCRSPSRRIQAFTCKKHRRSRRYARARPGPSPAPPLGAPPPEIGALWELPGSSAAPALSQSALLSHASISTQRASSGGAHPPSPTACAAPPAASHASTTRGCDARGAAASTLHAMPAHARSAACERRPPGELHAPPAES